MATTTAPLLSFGASGAIAKTQVYASWKGRQYARRYVIPANPNTVNQQATRGTFAWLNNLWKYMPGNAVAAWEAYADSNRYTSRNGWISRNLAALREQAVITAMTISPSARGGVAAAGITTTAGASQITVGLTAPSLPAGWTVSKAIAAAIRQQDPQSGTLFTVVAGEDATDPYSIVLAGLVTGEIYLVGGWFEFEKPDGSLAYGQSIQELETPT